MIHDRILAKMLDCVAGVAGADATVSGVGRMLLGARFTGAPAAGVTIGEPDAAASARTSSGVPSCSASTVAAPISVKAGVAGAALLAVATGARFVSWSGVLADGVAVLLGRAAAAVALFSIVFSVSERVLRQKRRVRPYAIAASTLSVVCPSLCVSFSCFSL